MRDQGSAGGAKGGKGSCVDKAGKVSCSGKSGRKGSKGTGKCGSKGGSKAGLQLEETDVAYAPSNPQPDPHPHPHPNPNQAVAKSVNVLGPRLGVALAPLLHRALSPEQDAPAWRGVSSAQDGDLGQDRNLGRELGGELGRVLTPLEVHAEATRRRQS